MILQKDSRAVVLAVYEDGRLPRPGVAAFLGFWVDLQMDVELSIQSWFTADEQAVASVVALASGTIELGLVHVRRHLFLHCHHFGHFGGAHCHFIDVSVIRVSVKY